MWESLSAYISQLLHFYDMNKVILLGNVGRDPRMRMVDSSQVADFPLATTERRTSRTPDGQEMQLPDLTEWHNIVMWGRLPSLLKNIYAKARGCLWRASCAHVRGKTITP